MNTASLEFQKRTPASFQGLALSMTASALCTAGAAAMLLPAFPHIPGSWAFYAAVGGILTAILCLLNVFPIGKWLPVSASAVVLVLFVIRFRAFRNGMLLLANDCLAFLTGKTGRVHLYYATQGEGGVLFAVMLYLILFSVLSSVMIYKRHLVYPVILLAVSTGAIVYGFRSSPLCILLLSTALAAAMVPFRQEGMTIKTRRTGFLAMLIPAGLALAAAALVLAAGAALGGPAVFRSTGAVHKIQRMIHTLQYESSDGSGMPEGDLRKDVSAKEDIPMLRITMSDPEKIYLRGFTADIYRDSIWCGPDSTSLIENAPLFYTLHRNEFYGQKMIASAAAASWGKLTTGTLSVRTENACRRYRYLPYGLADPSLLDPLRIGDAGAIAENDDSASRREAQLSYLPGSLPDWYEIALSLADSSSAEEDYLRYEQAYYEYVMELDRQLSPEAAAACASLFGSVPQDRRLSDILSLVYAALEDGFVFDEEGLAVSKEEDVLTSFLKEKRGSAVHYATAASVMLRYLGVPARYVEGYLLTAEEASSVSPGEEITLTPENAHAWAEFYLRGIGWIPFEATPGYVDNEELSRVAVLTEDSRMASVDAPVYAQSELIYTSGTYDTAASPFIENVHFAWKWEYLLLLLAAALILVIGWTLWKLNRRRMRFKIAMKRIRLLKEEGRFAEAITQEFAYAAMLMEEAGIQDAADYEQAAKLNEEALFSRHSMTKENASEIETFTENVVRACQRKWSEKERFYNHWVRWIV